MCEATTEEVPTPAAARGVGETVPRINIPSARGPESSPQKVGSLSTPLWCRKATGTDDHVPMGLAGTWPEVHWHVLGEVKA
jgi:hypothetical protein